MKTFSLVATLIFGVCMLASDRHQVESKKTCTKLFQCMPYLFTIPFKEMMNATYYYTNSLLSLSQISDDDWNSQMKTLLDLCGIWTNFDGCMDQDWIDCIDWDQLVAMVQLVGGAGDAAVGQTANTAQNAQERQKGLNQTASSFSSIGWTRDDTKKAMKIGSHLCKNIKDFVPYVGCMRDLVLSNETMINLTLWYQGLLAVPGCVQPDVTCTKVEKLTRLFGYWLYHGCEQATTVLTDIVRVIFEGMMFTDDELCAELFKDKTPEQLYGPMYDKSDEISFGNDISHCDLEAVKRYKETHYKDDVLSYITKQNLTREQFYHKEACRKNKINLSVCDIWPIPTTKAAVTTTTVTTSTAMTPKKLITQAGGVVTAARQQNSIDGNAKPAATTPKKNGKKTTTLADYDDDGAITLALDRRLLLILLSLAVFARFL